MTDSTTTAPTPPRPPRVRNCGTAEADAALLESDHAYAVGRVRAEEHVQMVMSSGALAGRTEVVVIPVIVHVLVDPANPATDVTQAQIDSQIAVLNQDFRLTNPDQSSIPAPFKDLAADALVEFRLADTDPADAYTTGVNRIESSLMAVGDPREADYNAIKFTARGGADAWPAANYLNMWVCQFSDDTLGYAQFPAFDAAAETDGVVILCTAFGTTGTVQPPFNLGRTATHEIGHWLDLRHIWGDRNDCRGDDLVADTPLQQRANTGSPDFPHVTCRNDPDGDMFMNYMDYVDDAAMFMFTRGQVERMQAALDGPRATLAPPPPEPE